MPSDVNYYPEAKETRCCNQGENPEESGPTNEILMGRGSNRLLARMDSGIRSDEAGDSGRSVGFAGID